MKSAISSEIDSLFARHPELFGFSVRDVAEVPDSCPRSGDEAELFIADVGIGASLTPEQYGEICQQIALTVAELLSEQPEAREVLCGRTFARTLH
jgi:hypothetical protein